MLTSSFDVNKQISDNLVQGGWNFVDLWFVGPSKICQGSAAGSLAPILSGWGLIISWFMVIHV